MKPILLVAPILLGLMTACATPKHSYKPAGGYVPDEKTAIAIALAVWTPIYGKKQVDSERPFHAELRDGVWQVYGSLGPSKPGSIPIGGVLEAEIARDDGRVLLINHGE